MPRGVKKNYDTQIEQINLELAKYQEKIQALKDKLSKLESEKRDSERTELYTLMAEQNISPDEVITLVKNR